MYGNPAVFRLRTRGGIAELLGPVGKEETVARSFSARGRLALKNVIHTHVPGAITPSFGTMITPLRM
jgi:hypothetical protein